MDGVATHDHRRVLRISQERHCPRVGDSVNTTQLDINLEANIREVLGLSPPALMTLQTLSRYSNLEGLFSQGKWMGARTPAHANVTETVVRVELQ